MKYEAFEALVRKQWESIPERYREGIDQFVIERDALPSPDQEDVYILGECLTDTYPSDFDGPDNIRSQIVLYYGSFRRLAAVDEEFDWEAETWETLTHELRHHLEALADETELDDVDRGMQQHFFRREGAPFTPGYHRLGEAREGGWFVLEHAWFIEISAGDDAPVIEWRGRRYRIETVHPDADFVYLDVTDGVEDPPEELCVVIARRPGLGDTVRGWLTGRSATSAQAEVAARVVN